jgi:hypothetical protein
VNANSMLTQEFSMKDIISMGFSQHGKVFYFYHHHHQPINVPTAGAQAFLMDYPQAERAFYFYGQG